MMTFKQLIDGGYEIKTATTVLVQGVLHQHLFVQLNGDVFVCIFKQNAKGGFDPAGSYQLA